MDLRFLARLARPIGLAIAIAAVAVLALAGAAWANPAGAERPRGRSTVPPREADVAVSKTAAPDGPNHVLFTVTVTNNGPLVAEDVRVIDNITDRNTRIVDVNKTKGNCDRGQDKVTCKLNNLRAGETVTISIRVRILNNFHGTIKNTARVSSDDPRDPNKSNNKATATIVV
jgi:uncharacterized repeat protein (TIGR01451 family)